MEDSLGPVEVHEKSGNEPFHQGGRPVGFDLLSFWRWSTSDLLSNATRGVLAEYLVTRAIEGSLRPRTEWDAFDASTKCGIRVEVKSSAYLQSWHQSRLSTISFGTSPTRAWCSETNCLAEERKRQSDVYVFCLLHHKDKATVDPLDLTQWTFFVISTQELNRKVLNQKSVRLSRLLKLGGVKEVDYSDLGNAIILAGKSCKNHELGPG